jgi:hypothetical protein
MFSKYRYICLIKYSRGSPYMEETSYKYNKDYESQQKPENVKQVNA